MVHFDSKHCGSFARRSLVRRRADQVQEESISPILIIVSSRFYREACTMYFLARSKSLSDDTWLGPLVSGRSEAQSTFELYLTSLYLSVVTFCTVGKFVSFSYVAVKVPHIRELIQ